MQFTRCTLKKDGKKVVLQGLIHGIPKPLLLWIRKDLRSHTENGYRVFHEGIQIYEDDEKTANFSEKESEPVKLNKLIEGIINEVFQILNLTPQGSNDFDGKDGIKYPENAINIDILYVEYIRLLTEKLAEENIDCRELMDMIEKIGREKIISTVAVVLEKLVKGETTYNEMDKKAKELDVLKILGFFRVSEAIDLDYRNRIACDNIEKYSKKRRFRKIYVHYGEAHIEAIANLLVNNGWKLIKMVKIDSQNPGLNKKRPRGVSFYALLHLQITL